MNDFEGNEIDIGAILGKAGWDDPEAPDENDLYLMKIEELVAARDDLMSDLENERVVIETRESLEDLVFWDTKWARFIQPELGAVVGEPPTTKIVLAYENVAFTIIREYGKWLCREGLIIDVAHDSTEVARVSQEATLEPFSPSEFTEEKSVSARVPAPSEEKLARFLDRDLGDFLDWSFTMSEVVNYFETLSDATRFISKVYSAMQIALMSEDDYWAASVFEDLEHFVAWIDVGHEIHPSLQVSYFQSLDNAEVIRAVISLGFSFKGAVMFLRGATGRNGSQVGSSTN